MKRTRVLTVLMWFCLIYAIGAAVGIGAASVDLGRYIGGYSIGGMPVSREQWLTIAAPLVATIAVFMAATAARPIPLGQWVSQFRGSLPGIPMKDTGWRSCELRPNQIR